MLKAALGIIVVATVIGALMPSAPAPLRETPPATAVVPAAATAPPTPGIAAIDGMGVIRLPRQEDGHFYVEMLVNGMPIRFLVDTGASMVALTVADARKASVPVDPAQFQIVGRGASGDVRGQVVELGQLGMAGKSVTNVDAVVIDGGEQSLLGQNFLSRFDKVEILGDEMLLH